MTQPDNMAPHAETQTANKIRTFRMAPFALVLICFTLPFLKISCRVEKNISFTFTGYQLAFGTEIGQNQEKRKIDREPLALAAFVCAILGAVMCNLASKHRDIFPAIAGAAGLVSLLVLRTRVDAQLMKQGEGMFLAEYKVGYVLACALLLAGTLMSVYLFKQRSEKSRPPPG